MYQRVYVVLGSSESKSEGETNTHVLNSLGDLCDLHVVTVGVLQWIIDVLKCSVCGRTVDNCWMLRCRHTAAVRWKVVQNCGLQEPQPTWFCDDFHFSDCNENRLLGHFVLRFGVSFKRSENRDLKAENIWKVVLVVPKVSIFRLTCHFVGLHAIF